MRNILQILFVITFGLVVRIDEIAAENWPGWRGPRGDGTSLESGIPTEWDGTTGQNIAWKTALQGTGHSSPIVWDDDIFVTACLEDQHDRVLICLDRVSGQIRWQQSVIESPLETKHSLNSYASGTPVTDGKSVYVSFLQTDGSTIPAPNVGRQRPVTPGQIKVAAFDVNGERQWISEPGEFISAHGFCSSPVIFEDLLIINGDHDGDSYIAALDRSTGKTVWKVPRRHKTRSYVTPILRDIDGRTQLVFSGSQCIVSLNPRDGSRYWNVEGPTEQYVASMVDDGRYFFMAAGFPTHHVMAIRPDGSGDVSDTHVAWHTTSVRCYVPSPVVVGQHLLVADDRGTANCFDTATGDRLWQGRLGNKFNASLTTAAGLVYFLADDGTMKIVKPGNKLNVVAENKLGEVCSASPALSQGQLFIRGEQHLFCIGKTEIASD